VAQLCSLALHSDLHHQLGTRLCTTNWAFSGPFPGFLTTLPSWHCTQSTHGPSRLNQGLDGAFDVAIVLKHEGLVELAVFEAHLGKVVQE